MTIRCFDKGYHDIFKMTTIFWIIFIISFITFLRADTNSSHDWGFRGWEDSEDEKSFNEESVDFDVQPGLGVSNILTQEDVEDQPFIVYLSQTLTLAKMHYLQNCQIKSCTEQVSVEKVVVKSALYLTWVCVKYFIK